MRLALVVLAARTPEATGVVEIRVRELGRWIGVSESYVSSEVLPGLRRAGAVRTDTIQGEFGEDRGLRCEVVPLWNARGVVGHPLALQRKELATLLRLCEALFAPGWEHRDGTVTPPGLLGSRTGRGAATDRLALLRLTLEATPTGRVRLCGGPVPTRRGRLAATVARLLGCSASGGERVLHRLESAGVVQRIRLATPSGLSQRSRLVIPAVAAAHRGASVSLVEGLRAPQRPVFSGPDVAAGPSEAVGTAEKALFSAIEPGQDQELPDPDAAAPLHTDHPSVLPASSSPTVENGFSGEAELKSGALPGRAYAREDSPFVAPRSPLPSLVGASGSPLRGENLLGSHRGKDIAGLEAVAVPASLRLVAGEKPQQQGRVPRPPDDLEVVLWPVSALWARLDRKGARDRVVAAVRHELGLLAHIVGPERASRALAERLSWRLDEQEGPARVKNPVGWIISRGLPRRAVCSDVRCDDGVRLDIGQPCQTCEYLVADRRGLRRRVAAYVDAQLPGLGEAERRLAVERQLREETNVAAAEVALRRDRLEQERAKRQQLLEDARRNDDEQRLAEQAAAEEEWTAVPCEDCGAADAAGLCGTCSETRNLERLRREAVTVAAAAWADPSDPEEVRREADAIEDTLRRRIDAAQQQLAERAGAAEEVTEHSRVLAARLAVEDVLAECRTSALEHLASSAHAEEEAQEAYSATMRSWRRYGTRACARKAAGEAAEVARQRAARHQLALRAGVLQGTVPADVLTVGAEPDPYALGAARARAELRKARAA